MKTDQNYLQFSIIFKSENCLTKDYKKKIINYGTKVLLPTLYQCTSIQLLN